MVSNQARAQTTTEKIEESKKLTHGLHSRLNTESKRERCDSFNTGKKRKINDTTRQEEIITKKKEDPIAFVLREALEIFTKTSNALNKVIEESPNTKREIKELTMRLKRGTEILNRKTTKEWIQAHRWEKIEIPKYEVDCQTDNKINKQDFGTQTCPWEQHSNPDEIQTLEEIRNLEQWKKSECKNWPNKIFKNTETMFGNPLSTEEKVVKAVFVEPNDTLMEKSIQKMFRDRFPDITQAGNEFEVLEQITKIRSKDPKEYSCQKVIKISHNGSDEDLWNKIRELKHETENDEYVAIHHINTMSLLRLRKMVECIFYNSKTRVQIFTNKPINKVQVEQNKKERNSYALMVEVNEKSYKEVLSNIKSVISDNPAKKIIKNIRSTKEGKLLITTDKDTSAINELKNIIATKCDNLKTRIMGLETKTKALHIRKMDATTTKEEIENALDKALGNPEQKGYKIGEPRPDINNRLAVTVTMNKSDAGKIEKMGNLRVGLVKCPVEKRIILKKCFRCWSYEHVARECKGPDRSSLCYNCGKEGHSTRNCQNEPTCPMCIKSDHRAGSGKCSVFQKALSREREKTNSNRQSNKSPNLQPVLDTETAKIQHTEVNREQGKNARIHTNDDDKVPPN